MGARILVVDDSPTIRKVVAAILAARAYQPIVAEDGQAALEKLANEAVDLILLDFVMPRMNGYQFCRELRAHPEFKSLPVVLMSAKGDKIRGQFVQQTGAIDAITKPFDARGLIAVIEGALKRHREGRARPLPDADAMPEEESIADSLPPGPLNLSGDPALSKLESARQFAAAIARLVVPELAKLPNLPRSASGGFNEAIVRAITPQNMGGFAALLRTLDVQEGKRDVLSGDISVISIAEVLQLLALQRQTGALAVFTRNREITLYVREGNIDFADWSGLGREFFIGRYLIELGSLSTEDLGNVLQNRAGSKKLLGESLVQLGHATNEQVVKALTRQTSELVYEVVRWAEGRFTFGAGVTAPPAEKAALGLTTGALVMEGFRRVDEWRLIEGSFDFDEVLQRDQVAIGRVGDESKLTKQERRVLDAIDGERTVREIVDRMAGSSFEVCKILYQFLNSRLVRRSAA